MSNVTKNTILCLIASVIRIWLVNSEYKKSITDRVEISTPLNAWKRVTEGVHLLNEGSNPYVGDLIHEPPLNLHVYKHLIQHAQDYLPCVFILTDTLTALLLYFATRKYLQSVLAEQKKMRQGTDVRAGKGKRVPVEHADDLPHGHLFLEEATVTLPPTYVFAAYLFNPYTVFSCVAMTTTVFHNFFIALYLCALVHRKPWLCVVSLAVSTTHALYSVILIVPVLVSVGGARHGRAKVALCLVSYLALLAAMAGVCCRMCGSWKFLENTFGFILLIPDLQPNIGLFWYFFTEMFEHFRALFISAFQINVVFLYLVPLAIRFQRDPVMLASSSVILMTIFKSYPSLGDVGLCLSLLPMWTHLVSYLQQGFFVSCCFLISTVLGPVVWHLWIYSRSANANFYFGVTLAFATAQIFLVTDLLFAYIKIEFWLKNSHVRNTDSGAAKLTLE